MRLKSALKKLAITLVLLGSVLGIGHVFLYFRAGYLLKSFVEEKSNNTYSISSKKLRFGYFPLQIRAADIHLYPIKKAELTRRYDIRADSIQLDVSSLSSLLFFSALEISSVKILRPFVLVEADGANISKTEAQFNTPLQEIQDGLLKGLEQFQVDKCVITDGGFRVTRTDIPKVLAINKIDLVIDSLLAAREGMLVAGSDTLRGHITLNLNNPTIVIPDSNYLVDVDRLYIDTKRNIFSIEELRFSQSKEGDAYDTIQLSTIELRGLNWNGFLSSGIIELDSVRVKNGLAQIDLSDRRIFQKNDSKNKDEFEVQVPIVLHNTSINQINYTLRSKRKDGLFTMQLQGDSLTVKGFKLVDSLDPKLSLGSLSLNVKNYTDSDDKRTYRGKFDRLLINTTSLVLLNYELVPLRMDAFGNNNRLKIPSLSLQGYNITELLNGRLSANRIVLNKPDLIIDIKKKQAGKQSNGKQSIFHLLRKLEPSLDLNELEINNASITLQPRSDKTNSITVSQLNTIINVEKLLKAQSVKDLMQVSEGLTTDGFFISGPNFDFKVDYANISSTAEDLSLRRLRGTIAGNLDMDLDSVIIKSRKGELPFPVDGFLGLELVTIQKGNIMVNSTPRENKPKTGKEPPELFIDKLTTGPLSVTYINKEGEASQGLLSKLDFQNLKVKGEDIAWSKAALAGRNISTAVGNNNLSIGSWQAQIPGKITVNDTYYWPQSLGGEGITARIPLLSFTANTNAMSWNPNLVGDVMMRSPQLRWKKAASDSGTAKKPMVFPDININSITIVQPDVEGGIMNKKGQDQSFNIKEGNLMIKNLEMRAKDSVLITVGSVMAILPDAEVKLDTNLQFTPGIIRFRGSGLGWSSNGAMYGMIDTFFVKGIGKLPFFKDNKQNVSMEYAGISGWQFPIKIDSLPFRLTTGPDWWAGNIQYEMNTPTHALKVHNINAARNDRRIQFDSLSFIPHDSRDGFFKQYEFEKDFISVRLGLTTMYDVIPSDLQMQRLKVAKMMTDKIELYVSRDKTFPEDTISYRPLLTKQIQGIPYAFELDTLQVNDGSVTYTEISAKTEEEGIFLVDQLSGSFYQLSSLKNNNYDSLLVDVHGRFMGISPLQLKYAQSYADTMQGFRLNANISEWPVAIINPLIVPLVGVEMRNGQADTMLLWVIGDNDEAFGEMGFKYSKLRVGILKKGTERKYFLSGIVNGAANLVLRNNSDGKMYPVYFARLKDKGTFNYWAKILSTGMQINLRVPFKGRAAKKYMRKQKAAGLLPEETPEIKP